MCILATSNQNCRAMFQARTFIVALEAMKRHQDYLGVQIAGCKLLVLLAAFEPHRATLVEQDIIHPILHALIEFKDCTELQINGLSALAHLAEALGNKLQNGKFYGWPGFCHVLGLSEARSLCHSRKPNTFIISISF